MWTFLIKIIDAAHKMRCDDKEKWIVISIYKKSHVKINWIQLENCCAANMKFDLLTGIYWHDKGWIDEVCKWSVLGKIEVREINKKDIQEEPN